MISNSALDNGVSFMWQRISKLLSVCTPLASSIHTLFPQASWINTVYFPAFSRPIWQWFPNCVPKGAVETWLSVTGYKDSYCETQKTRGSKWVSYNFRGSRLLQMSASRNRRLNAANARARYKPTPYIFLLFVVPCIMLYNGEISPTRCKNCVFYSQWLYSTCFRSTMLYMATGKLVHSVCY